MSENGMETQEMQTTGSLGGGAIFSLAFSHVSAARSAFEFAGALGIGPLASQLHLQLLLGRHCLLVAAHR